MKNLIKKNFIFIVGAALSICAFIYLNTVEVKTKNSADNIKFDKNINKEVEESKSQTPIITSLPGIDAAKKVITLVQKFLPTNI